MTRKISSGWLQTYRKYIHKQEAPDIFHLWIGLTLISATLKRNIWIDRGAYKVYPNQYVILVAESASCRKSVAMELGLDLLLANKDIRAVHERLTVEGLTDLMNRASVTPTGKIRPDGSVLLHADELSNMFSRASYITDLVSFLTAAYTSKSRLDFLTRNKGFVQVRNPCPVLLAGTTPDQLGEIFPSMVLSSGFFGRILIVTAQRGHREPKPQIRKDLIQDLVDDLYDMSLLQGEIKLTKECDSLFDSWYLKMEGSPSPNLNAFYERKHDHVLKSAMLLSISESNDLVITVEHFKAALEAIEFLEQGMIRTTEFMGATAKSDIGELLVKMIRKNAPSPMSHSVLMRRVYKRIQDSTEFKEIIDTLLESNRIEVDSANNKGLFYKIKKEEEDG